MSDTSAILERAIADLTVEVRALRDELDRRLPEPASGPLTTWKRIARALGVSDDTLAKRRKDAGDRQRPWFPNAEAARAWYDALVKPKPLPSRRAPRPSKPTGGAVDWKAVGRGGR